jgi:hypothetical protein
LPFAEDKVNFHYWKPTDEELDVAENALRQIEEGIE